MNSKEKFIQYLQEFMGIVLTAILCYGIYRWGGGHDKACFAITLGAVAYLLLCFYNAIFKNLLRGMIQRILSGLTVIAFANELYDYNNIIAVFPVLKNVEPTLFAFILLGSALIVLISIKTMIYIYENSDRNGDNSEATELGKENGISVDDSTRNSYHSTAAVPHAGDGNTWTMLYLIFLVAIVGGLVALFTVLYGRGFLKQNYDFFGVLSFLTKYAGSIVIFLLAVVIVMVIFIELIKMIILRIKAITVDLKMEERSSTGPLYLLSIIVDFIVCYFAYKSTGIDMGSFVEFVNDGKYLALPLTVLFVGVAFIIFLRLTHATLVLLVDMKPEKVKELLKEVNKKTEITSRLVEIIKTIIDVILDTVIIALQFVEFIPNFFGTIYSFVLEDKEEFDEDDENTYRDDNDEEKVLEDQKNS